LPRFTCASSAASGVSVAASLAGRGIAFDVPPASERFLFLHHNGAASGRQRSLGNIKACSDFPSAPVNNHAAGVDAIKDDLSCLPVACRQRSSANYPSDQSSVGQGAIDLAQGGVRFPDALLPLLPDFNTFPIRQLLRSAQRIDLT
jgi:hypothetical protein